MKPTENGITLEGQRDRRYVTRAAILSGNFALAEEVERCVDCEYTRLYNQVFKQLSARELSRIRESEATVEGRFMWAIPDNDLRAEVARERTRTAFLLAEVTLDTGLTPQILEALGTLANMSRLAAARHLLNPQVARAMINSFTIPPAV